MIHSVYFLTDVASVTNQPLLLLQFLIYLDGWLITIPPSHTSGSPLLFLSHEDDVGKMFTVFNHRVTTLPTPASKQKS